MVLEWVESQCEGPSDWETTSAPLEGVGKILLFHESVVGSVPWKITLGHLQPTSS